jgi:sugar-phosphatase
VNSISSANARALLIDMDGTLVDSSAVIELLWSDWCRLHGVDAALVLPAVHGRQSHDVMAEFLPERSREENLAEQRIMLDREAVMLDGIVEIAGAAAFVDSLDGVLHVLVTSADVPLATGRLGAAGVRMPAARITAEDVERSKPHPEGFLRGASLLGVDPSECIVLEDSAAGIAAARAAGMRVIGVGEASAAHTPDLVVADLTALRVAPSDADDGSFTVSVAGG